MEYTRWYLLIGALLILLTVLGVRVKRLPITTALIYLVLGWLLGSWGWIRLDALEKAGLLERLSEVAVIVSLFSAGLKLRAPIGSRLWRAPVWLAFGSMVITVGLLTLAGVFWLGLPTGAAVILGAVLAPTDPVLASDVQVTHPRDVDRVRYTLTGEAGLNDGTAFPFIMLGLGLLGLHEIGVGAWRWLAVDVVWAIGGGLALGAALGTAVARLVIHLRRRHQEAVGLDDFLALGLIAVAYGLAILMHVYGFLAVFAAGVGLRTVERNLSDEAPPPDVKAAAASETDLASHPEHAPAFMAAAVLQFNEQVERLGELALVLVAGAVLSTLEFSLPALGMALLLFCIIRPLAVAPIARACGLNTTETLLTSWFGVRGIGSVYYLFHAIGKGLPEAAANLIISVTLWVIALSVCVHGITVTPFMRIYEQRRRRRRGPGNTKSAKDRP